MLPVCERLWQHFLNHGPILEFQAASMVSIQVQYLTSHFHARATCIKQNIH